MIGPSEGGGDHRPLEMRPRDELRLPSRSWSWRVVLWPVVVVTVAAAAVGVWQVAERWSAHDGVALMGDPGASTGSLAPLDGGPARTTVTSAAGPTTTTLPSSSTAQPTVPPTTAVVATTVIVPTPTLSTEPAAPIATTPASRPPTTAAPTVPVPRTTQPLLTTPPTSSPTTVPASTVKTFTFDVTAKECFDPCTVLVAAITASHTVLRAPNGAVLAEGTSSASGAGGFGTYSVTFTFRGAGPFTWAWHTQS